MMANYKRLLNSLKNGSQILHEPLLNKGTSFTEAERDKLGLRGLLPPKILSLDTQKEKIMQNFFEKKNDLEKYIYMIALQDRNETLFYHTVINEIEFMMPIIYTPTVGKACQEYDHIFRRPRGLYISIEDKDNIKNILRNWPNSNIDVIVVTDGERILGLGDLGVNGMGIPVGKLCLYTSCAGIDPSRCLPITLDVGTNNAALLKNPLYLGLQQKRTDGIEYDSFLDKFMKSVSEIFPKAVIQFEDFANANAARLLKKYQNLYRTFNDDIQGTAAVAVAGIMSSMKVTSQSLEDQVIVFYGAGTAGIGIGNLLVKALIEKGIPENIARRQCWFVDRGGLVVQSRKDLSPDKVEFAHDYKHLKDLTKIIETLKPTILIGVSGQGNSFTQKIIKSLSDFNDQPIIFALSNPTSKSECTAESAYKWTNGRAIFASGSPFDPIQINDRTLIPSQGNNVYIFPGVGLGALVSKAKVITDSLFLTAAKELSELTSSKDLISGRLYPPLNQIRDVSRAIAVAVAKKAAEDGLSETSLPSNLDNYISEIMYDPIYNDYTSI
ncbi:MAG: NAD-dependent malic enzyme [Candidatus Marinimicrobia bacterium]|nr:NAD-dependent malic enzyme [Candidatus Neomarinimicrobiota bacterium]